jgi:hypothetical protein
MVHPNSKIDIFPIKLDSVFYNIGNPKKYDKVFDPETSFGSEALLSSGWPDVFVKNFPKFAHPNPYFDKMKT